MVEEIFPFPKRMPWQVFGTKKNSEILFGVLVKVVSIYVTIATSFPQVKFVVA